MFPFLCSTHRETPKNNRGDKEAGIVGFIPFQEVATIESTRQQVNGVLHLNTNVISITHLPHYAEGFGKLITIDHFVDFVDCSLREVWSENCENTWDIEIRMFHKTTGQRVRTTTAKDVIVYARIAITSESTSAPLCTADGLRTLFKKRKLEISRIMVCSPRKRVEVRYLPVDKVDEFLISYLLTKHFDDEEIGRKGFDGGIERKNEEVEFIVWVDGKNSQTSVKVEFLCDCAPPSAS